MTNGEELRYTAQLAAWQEIRKADLDAAKAAKVLAGTREDARTAVDATRADTVTALEAARLDTLTGLAETRADTLTALEAARLDARSVLTAARVDADRASEEALVKGLHDAYIDVTKSSLDRAITRVNVLTASVSAVVGLYTGLLGLVYVAKPPGDAARLPASALVPAIFLGLTLVLVSYYAASFKKGVTKAHLLPSGIGGSILELRIRTFMAWCFAGILNRAWALRAAIASLGLGVATLPLPFVQVPDSTAIVVPVVGLFLVFMVSLWSYSADINQTPTGATTDIRAFAGSGE